VDPLPKPPSVSILGKGKLNGRTLKISLSCLLKGSASVSYKGKRVGKDKFPCKNGNTDTARIKLSRKNAKRLLGKRIRVTAKAGSTAFLTERVGVAHAASALSTEP
jgi:hypothetical protein